MICKKCGIELGQKDRCPKCGFMNDYKMNDMPEDLKEIDDMLPRVFPPKTERHTASEQVNGSVPPTKRIRPAYLDSEVQPLVQKTRPVSSNGQRRIPQNQEIRYVSESRSKASDAERYLGKAPKPEFKRRSPKKKNKGLLYLGLGMAVLLAIGFCVGLLTGRALWYHPKNEAISQTESVQTESRQTEPVQTEPRQTEPVQTEPRQTEPVQTEPRQTESVQTESRQTEPVQTEPRQTESDVFGADTYESEVPESGNGRGDINRFESEGNRGGSPVPSYSDGRWH